MPLSTLALDAERRSNLSPAERIINTLLTYTGHIFHGRTGVVTPDRRYACGVRWDPAVSATDAEGVTTVSAIVSQGRNQKPALRPLGRLMPDNSIAELDARWQPPGPVPEVALWAYQAALDVWTLDNEFAARWASYSFAHSDSRDLLVVLAALLLTQSRSGRPVRDTDASVPEGASAPIAFMDDDFRAVGEALCLLGGPRRLLPKQLLRIRDLLSLPAVADANRKAGFGVSTRRPPLGRWRKAVTKWLHFVEQNPPVFAGLLKANYRTSVMRLAEHVGFRPDTPDFFTKLRWPQVQSRHHGARTILLGVAVAPVDDGWGTLDERGVCERITQERPSWKTVMSRVPPAVGLTRAVIAAAVEAGCMSDKDLLIATPTLEDRGLLQVPSVKARWDAASTRADDLRALSVLRNVRSQEAKAGLEKAADAALRKSVEKTMAERDLRLYIIVDISSSMQGAIEAAKRHILRLIPAFPLDRMHIAVFNTFGREIKLREATRAGVLQAFSGIQASGGTSYGAGLAALAHHRVQPNEDLLIIAIGDEEAYTFDQDVRALNLSPAAFGMIRVEGAEAPIGWNAPPRTAVRVTAARLGVPCFEIEEEAFSDAYAVPQLLRALVASTPVTARVSTTKSLIDLIWNTPLLAKPAWAP